MVSEKVLKELKQKVDQSEFDDEIRHIISSISLLDGAGKTSTKSRLLPKQKVASGISAGQGMSKQDKQQLADLLAAQETIQSTLRTFQ